MLNMNATTLTLFNLTSSPIISIAGPDAEKFLQGQLTVDMKEINPAQSRLFAHCNAKGRVKFSGRLFFKDEAYYAKLPAGMTAIALNSLKKYAVFSKVKLEDVSGNYTTMGILTTQPKLLNITLPQLPDETVTIDNCLLTRLSDTQNIRYEIFGSTEALQKLTAKLNITEFSEDFLWNYYNVRTGIAEIQPETTELFTPHHLNYGKFNAIGLTKGCYTGQEIVARMHYLGKMKESLVIVKCSGEELPLAGSACYADSNKTSNIGNLVSVAKGPDGIYALASLRNETLTLENLFLENQKVISIN